MKKVAFAIQVFGLIAIFPVWIVAELNRGSERVTMNNSYPNIIKEQTKKNVQSKLDASKENSQVVLFMYKSIHF